MCGIGFLADFRILLSKRVVEQLKYSRSSTKSQAKSRRHKPAATHVYDPSDDATLSTAPSSPVCSSAITYAEYSKHMLSWIRPRGPDQQRLYHFPSLSAYMMASVLNLRGVDGHPTSQPIFSHVQPIVPDGASEPVPVDSTSGPVLSWNGEIFHGSLAVPVGMNDGVVLHRALASATASAVAGLPADAGLDTIARAVSAATLRVLDGLQGPFAAVYLVPVPGGHLVMAARDRVGRRSLLLALDREEAAAEARGAALCSAQVTHALGADGRVGTELEHPLSAAVWHELPCSGLFTTVVPAAGAASMHFLPWTTLSAHHPAAHASHNPYRLPSHTPLSALPALPASLRPLLAALPLPAQHALRRLSEAVRRHVVALPVPDPDADAPDAGVAPVAVLFSGGLDCALLAALLHHHLPAHAPVDLVNVAFQGEATDAFVDATVPDRVAALLAWADLERCCPARQWRLIKVNITLEQLKQHRDAIFSLTRPHDTVMDFNIAAVLYFGARGSGKLHRAEPGPTADSSPLREAPPVRLAPAPAPTPTPQTQEALPDAAEASPFPSAPPSREEEWAWVAALDKPARIERKKLAKEAGRLQFLLRRGEATAEELDAFLAENGPRLIELRCPVPGLDRLLAPRQAAAKAPVEAEPSPAPAPAPLRPAEENFRTTARVFILGSGADEQFGGYGRHRTAWRIANRRFCDQLRAAGQLRPGEGEDESVFGKGARGGGKPDAGDEEEDDGADGAIALADSSGDESDIDECLDRLEPPTPEQAAFSSFASASGRRLPWLVRQQRCLRAELNRDVHRLWVRNLGRDDRALSHWGREARLPFLDEDLMLFVSRFRADWKRRHWSRVQASVGVIQAREREVAALLEAQRAGEELADPGCVPAEDELEYPLEALCDMRMGPGAGDKLVLRQVAAALGVDSSSRLVKRAMQFGTKMAKRELVGTVVMSGNCAMEDVVNSRYLTDPLSGKKPGEQSAQEMQKERKNRERKSNKLALNLARSLKVK